MKKITILSFARYEEQHLDKLQAVSPHVEIYQPEVKSVDDLPTELCEQVNVLYGWGDKMRQAHRFPQLYWIQTHSAGVDFLLDTPVWRSDVIVTNVSGIHAIPMSEHTLAMMLYFRWRVADMRAIQAQGAWPDDRWDIFSGAELRGSTLGIIGYGAIGRELARQADALGMRVLALNRSGQRSTHHSYREPGTGDPHATIPTEVFPTEKLLTVLPQCDYVVLLAPLTEETRHMFNAEAFAAMAESAYFFNLARGGLVDETALINALQTGQIAGAGLDVFETEPLPADSPLWSLDNVLLSPHVAGFSPQYDERASDLFAENLRRYLADEPLLNLVDRGKGY